MMKTPDIHVKSLTKTYYEQFNFQRSDIENKIMATQYKSPSKPYYEKYDKINYSDMMSWENKNGSL